MVDIAIADEGADNRARTKVDKGAEGAGEIANEGRDKGAIVDKRNNEVANEGADEGANANDSGKRIATDGAIADKAATVDDGAIADDRAKAEDRAIVSTEQ